MLPLRNTIRRYATKLSYDRYPFLKELGIEAENNAGSYVDGKWVKGKNILQSVNPATNEVIATVNASDLSMVNTCIESMQKARKDWAKVCFRIIFSSFQKLSNNN